ncbi:MAG: shikimate kinase [Rectinemataceae bacterium]|nr:shikimate kinase [Spirochaetaceae bacterium]
MKIEWPEGRAAIALIGFMGSGKTATGREIARILDVHFADLDARLEAATGCTIAQIFEREGAERFRELEQQCLSAALLEQRPQVLACGGGIVLREANRQMLRERCITVWIDVPLEELLARLASQRAGRPLLQRDDWQEEVGRLLRQRIPLYQATAAIIYHWQGEKNPADTAGEIVMLVEAYYRQCITRG